MERISITKVARMLGVSKPTVYTKKRQLGLPQNHKGITEEELFTLSSYLRHPKKPGRKPMIDINPKAVNLAKILYDAGMTLDDTALFLDLKGFKTSTNRTFKPNQIKRMVEYEI
jgi:hypothetical protein